MAVRRPRLLTLAQVGFDLRILLHPLVQLRKLGALVFPAHTHALLDVRED